MLMYRNIKTPPRDFKTEVSVFYGPTGTGKSRWLWDNLPRDKVFYLNSSRTKGDPWFDYYDPMQHEHVVLDDYYGWFRWDTFLRMLDHYPMTMETKGDKIPFRAKYIWITSNKPPEQWYPKLEIQGHDFATLLRRINLIWKFTGPNTWVEERRHFEEPE